MVQPNWGLSGNAFHGALATGLQLGQMAREREEEAERKNALTAYATKPGPDTIRGVIQADPATGIQLQQNEAKLAEQKRAQALKDAERNREFYRMGAKIVREVNPQDQAGWDQVLGISRQMGIPLDQLGVPGQFDPAFRDSVVAVADALDPQKDQQVPSFIREAEALGIPLAEAKEIWKARQGTVVINGIPHRLEMPDGAPVLTDADFLEEEGGSSQSAGSGGFR